MSVGVSAVASGSNPVHTMTGASGRAPTRQKMSILFDKIDTTGSGSISKAQFSSAFQSMNPPRGFRSLGAGAVFAKMDPGQSGSVSRSDFLNTMSALSRQLQSHPAAPASASSSPTPAGTGAHVNTAA